MKIDKNIEELNKEWDRRWEGSDKKEKLTLLAKKMFKSKIKYLNELIRDLDFKTVIEVGCGLGHILQVYHDKGYDSYGIDISQNSIKTCQKKNLNVELKDVKDITKKYNLVSSDGMLEHFINFEPFVEHFTRISNKYVLIIQPNHESFVGKTLVYIAELIRGNQIVFEYNYRINDFISVFKKYNFKCIKNQPVFMDVFRIIIFEKNI